uniref:G-protein coupled receptors family 1 profile domain-containing protein n=1 Tax=Chelonoidis abingdonii TaxID=106734 RepID=A0A8C0GVZ2_CHEAB
MPSPNISIQHFMSIFNLTPSDPSTFILMGISGLEAAHIWISIPFSTFYIIGLLGNFTVLFVVGKEQTLHKPMYLLLCMLALTDIGTSTSVVPKALCLFWFNLKDITLGGCLTQMFFLHGVSMMHSAILVTMAFDRYIAICNPLRYATILTNGRIIGLAVVFHGSILILPYPFLVSQWPYCRTNIIPHMHCEHIAVAKLACADTRISSYYGLFVVFCERGLDMIFIAVSYTQILKVIISHPIKDAQLKDLGTCCSHLCVILAFYIPGLFSFLTHRFGHNVPLHFQVLIANVYLLVFPMLNPIIYGVRTKQIRDRLLRLFTHKRT